MRVWLRPRRSWPRGKPQDFLPCILMEEMTSRRRRSESLRLKEEPQGWRRQRWSWWSWLRLTAALRKRTRRLRQLPCRRCLLRRAASSQSESRLSHRLNATPPSAAHSCPPRSTAPIAALPLPISAPVSFPLLAHHCQNRAPSCVATTSAQLQVARRRLRDQPCRAGTAAAPRSPGCQRCDPG